MLNYQDYECIFYIARRLKGNNREICSSTFTRRILASMLLFLSCGWSAGSYALSNVKMQDRYRDYLATRDVRELPFTLSSDEEKGIVSVGVTTFLPGIPFELFAERLSMVSEWCEFVPLHLNIKACQFDHKDGQTRLGFYVGVKGHLTPDQADLLMLNFNARVEDSVLLISFFSDSGPYGSSNIGFEFRAIEGDGGVYLEFDLSSKPGLIESVAKLYLATVARHKVGFSVVGETWLGDTKYVGGQRGGSERNIVRYLLAIQTYFETLDVEPEDERYRQRLERWFDYTEKYKRQLYEMDREDYISIKSRERNNQTILMAALESGEKAVYGPEKDEK